ncbi:hypothetical protein D6833_10630 [Candidatus Parcubacteria bacterium]|nr:MAG: hypothetical protein D6833_10630 [Candidatus Parcubacteria bacterium]
MRQRSFRAYVVGKAAGFRCGMVLPYREVAASFADLSELHNIAVEEDSTQPWKSASGGIHWDRDRAVMAAIGEALERYAASAAVFPVRKLRDLKQNARAIPHSEWSLFSDEQYSSAGFPWKRIDPEDAYFGEAYSLLTNERVWVPQELIGLGPRTGEALFPSTSTGVAAHFDVATALLLALQEVLERDALTVYWLNSLGGREMVLSEKYLAPVRARRGKVWCFDMTQDWNPHPVVAVCGYLPQRNKRRISLGAACRPTYKEAIEKAYLEWVQGVVFAGYYDVYHPDLRLEKREEVTDFDRHAVYYTLHPHRWEKVPLLRKRRPFRPSRSSFCRSRTARECLPRLLASLQKAGIRVFYRDLTTPDVRDVGLTVVRVLSPELSLLHGDERVPFLGGRVRDVAWRYPDKVADVAFPNPNPHPLG